MTGPHTQYRVLYSGWSIPRSSFLFGMSTRASVWFLVIAIAFIALIMFGFGVGFAVTFAAIAYLLWSPMVLRFAGRSLYEWSGLARQWRRHTRKGEDMFLSGLFSRVPNGTNRLPGLLHSSELHEGWDQHRSGHKYGVVHLPATKQSTVVIECFPQGNEAIDQEAVNVSVFNWGTFLNYLGDTSDVDGATVVIETGPETGNRLRREVAELVRPSMPGGPLPTAMMTESAEILPYGSVRMWARVAITFKATSAARRDDVGEQIAEISRRLGGLLTVLDEANLNPRMLGSDEIVALTKRAYSPSTLNALELADIDEGGHDLGWEDAGPMAHRDKRSTYWHDGCFSTTWEMSLAPSQPVPETVLRPVVDVNGDLVRKRVAIVYRPHSPSDAANLVNKDYKNALSGRNSGKGVASVEADLRVEATEQQRQEQGRGHGLTRFGIMITITNPEDSDVPRNEAIVRDLTMRASLRVRRMYLQQSAAFAATIGIGVLLPDHASVSRKHAE